MNNLASRSNTQRFLHGRGTSLPPVAAEPAAFDYKATAELFPPKGGSRTGSIEYLKFANAADAVRFAVETLVPQRFIGTYLEVNENRFDSKGIRSLYDDAAYPLKRGSH